MSGTYAAVGKTLRWGGVRPRAGEPAPAAPPPLAPPYAPESYPRATEEDLGHCFRLFLKREPNLADLAHWKERLVRESLTLHDLVRGFLGSDEFAFRLEN